MDQTLRIQAAGAEFHAQQRGPQPRAVFIHGFGGDLQTWDSVWAVLNNQLPALRYDLRGFGRSTGGDGAPFVHADDLLAILDARAIGRCDLVGVSMGGSIAVNFALDHPERVRSLVLISPGLVAWEWSEPWRELWQRIVSQARCGALDQARRLWWEHPLFDTIRGSAAGPALYESIMRLSAAHWIGDAHRPMLPDMERLHQLRTRTLLLTGGRDLEDFRLIAEVIAASAGSLARIDEPALGHLLHLEDPQACARRMLAFLDAGRSAV